MANITIVAYKKTDSFAQFDSALGVFGKVDFMLVNTEDGRAMIRNSCMVNDKLFGMIKVIQPTDYIILKLMAIANNPDRCLKDELDISELINLLNSKLLLKEFLPLDAEKIYRFADQFGQRPVIQKYLTLTIKKNSATRNHQI